MKKIISLQGLRITSLFPGYSLRARLITLLLGVSFISIFVVTIVTGNVVTTQLNISLGKNLTTIAENNAAQIGSFLEQNYDRMNIFVLNKSIQDSVDIANEKGTASPARLGTLEEKWQNSSDISPFVRGTQNNAMATALRELKIYYPDIEEAFITDRNGAVIAATDRTSNYYYANEAWWQSTWNNGLGGFDISQPTIEEVTATNATETSTINVINIAITISGHNRNEVIGVMHATINLDRINAILAANRFGDTGRTALIFRPFEKFIEGEQELELLALPKEALDEIDSISGVAKTIVFDDAPSLVSTARVSAKNPRIGPTISNLNWIILVHQDISEVQEPINVTARSVFLSALVVLLIVGLLAYYVGNQFMRPIEDLTRTATLLAQGDLYARASTESQGEIGTLAKTLNTMSAQVRELVSTLEQQVADRTKALETSTEVSRRLSTILDEKLLVSEVVNQVKNAFDYYHTHIYLIDEKSQDLVMSGGTGDAGQNMLAHGHRISKGVGLVGRAAETNTPVLVSDISSDKDWLPNPLLPETKSEIAVPISIGPKVLGVLDVQHNITDGLNQQDVNVLRAISNQIAIALQNARTYANSLQRAEREALITSINQKIQSETSVESALQVAVREVGRVLGTQAKVKMIQKGQKNEEGVA